MWKKLFNSFFPTHASFLAVILIHFKKQNLFIMIYSLRIIIGSFFFNMVCVFGHKVSEASFSLLHPHFLDEFRIWNREVDLTGVLFWIKRATDLARTLYMDFFAIEIEEPFQSPGTSLGVWHFHYQLQFSFFFFF